MSDINVYYDCRCGKFSEETYADLDICGGIIIACPECGLLVQQNPRTEELVYAVQCTELADRLIETDMVGMHSFDEMDNILAEKINKS